MSRSTPRPVNSLDAPEIPKTVVSHPPPQTDNHRHDEPSARDSHAERASSSRAQGAVGRSGVDIADGPSA
eukprot:279204-Pyramimonas_sp.AAC.1